jgi:KUP system potassium uptake protein
MLTWRRGRKVLGIRVKEMTVPLDLFLGDLATQKIHRVPGTAVFMSSNPTGTPLALLHNLKHNKVLHRHVVVLTVVTEELPYVTAAADRAEIRKLDEGFWRVKLRYGFMERPDVPAALANVDSTDLRLDPMRTTYFIGRETILSLATPELPRWRGAIFAWMNRNTGDVTSYFGLPPNAVVELGARVEV